MKTELMPVTAASIALGASLMAEGKLVAEYVETGVSDGQYIEIVSGVSEGEAVYYQSNDLARFFAMQQLVDQYGAGHIPTEEWEALNAWNSES